MLSILTFIVLIAGFVYLKHQQKKELMLFNDTVFDNGFLRMEYPDGTVQDRVGEEHCVYYFDNGNYIKIENDVEFHYVNGVVTTENKTMPPSLISADGKILDSLGFTIEKPFEVYTANAESAALLKELLLEKRFEEVESLLVAMQKNKFYIPIEALFIELAVQSNVEAVEFVQKALNYTAPASLWEEVALELCQTPPPALDIPAPIIEHMKTKKGWVSNTVVNEVLSRRRYDLANLVFSHGKDFRTFHERFCMHAQQGNNIALRFMPDASSSSRVMAFYLAAINKHNVLAENLLKSFNKDQRESIRKMFKRLKNKRERVLAYFE